jgi:hypothetical protein
MIGVLFLICFHCMLVCDVWSVAYERFGDFAVVEDYQDPEQFLVLVEGKSLLHFRYSYYNMHFNYTVI